MKRAGIVLCLMMAVCTGVRAADASWGVGATGGFFVNEMNNSLVDPAVSTEARETYLPFGLMAYVDGRYFEMDAGFTVMTMGYAQSSVTVDGQTSASDPTATGRTWGYLTLAMLGKYPVPLGLWTLSAILGFQADLNLLAVDDAGNDLRASMTDAALSSLSKWWIKAGAGLDIPFSYRGYVRAELILGCKLLSSTEREAYLNVTNAGFSAVWFTLEPDLRLCVGWKL